MLLTTTELSKALRIPRPTIEWYVREKVLSPTRTPSGRLRFDLKDAKVVLSRIRRIVRIKRMPVKKLYALRLWERA